MDRRHLALICWLVALVGSVLLQPAARAATGTAPYVTLRRQSTAASFGGSTLRGVAVAENGGTQIRLAAKGYVRGGNSRLYGQRRYWSGTLESPALDAATFDSATPSWNAVTPAGTWIQFELRVFRPDQNRWTKYYNLGIWASGNETIKRKSLGAQRDADGAVATDTLLLRGAAAYTRFQYRLTLFTTNLRVSPTVKLVAVATSDTAKEAAGFDIASDQQAWGVELTVPQRSQMIYKGGGPVWCSPTSTSMVLAYWGTSVPVPSAAAATYDHTYRGNGNWPFNTAWAATHGYEAFVTRMGNLAQAEEWISAGVPVIISIAYSDGELAGAPFGTSSGHILVLRGFDAAGNAIVNDPAFPSDAEVRAVYDRATLERLWLKHSGGVAYLIYPRGHASPTDKAHGSW